MTAMAQPASPLSVGSLAQLTLSLIAIVALILAIELGAEAAASWPPRAAPATCAVLDQLSVGPRERIAADSRRRGAGAGRRRRRRHRRVDAAEHAHCRCKPAARPPAFADRLRDLMKRPGSARMIRALPRSAYCSPRWQLLALPRCCRSAPRCAGALPAVAIKSAADGAQTYSLTFQILILMTVLTLLPAILLAMTAFTRIIIVLSILRQALGMATTPSNQMLTGLALFLTFFVMSTTLEQSYAPASSPTWTASWPARWRIDRTVQPLKKFMLAQTRENDLQLFTKLVRQDRSSRAPDDVPLVGADSDLHHQRTEDRLSDRLHGVHSLSGDRPGRRQRADVDGHDDALAGAGVAAVQDHAVRRGRRLDAADRHPGVEFSPMTPENVMDLAHKTLMVTSMIAAPLLLIALIAGLVIGMLQAATQINESTLSFIPKLLLLVLTLFVGRSLDPAGAHRFHARPVRQHPGDDRLAMQARDL